MIILPAAGKTKAAREKNRIEKTIPLRLSLSKQPAKQPARLFRLDLRIFLRYVVGQGHPPGNQVHLEHAAAFAAHHHIIPDAVGLRQLCGVAEGKIGAAVGAGARGLHQHIPEAAAVSDNHRYTSLKARHIG